jgi:predicted transcriptional regulator
VNIDIRDPSLEARLKKQIETTESGSVEEVLEILLDTKEQQDLWLQLNREAINAKIQRGLDQLDRGEVIPEEELDSYLAKLKKNS